MSGAVDKSMVMLCAIYTAAHLLLLFNSGIFWDDYTVFRIDPATNVDTFRQAGMPLIGYYHNLVSGLPHAELAYRTIIFCSYLLSTLCLYKLLERVPAVDPLSRFYIAAFFSVFPVNSARITFICSPYAICHAMFFLAFYLVARYLDERRPLLRLLSLTLFFASFITNSLLVYFALVLFFILYKEQGGCRKASDCCLIAARYADYLLLAPAFWLLKLTFSKSYGVFKEYNKLSLEHILAFPLKFVVVIKETVTEVALVMFPSDLAWWLPLFAACLLAGCFLSGDQEAPSKRLLSVLLAAGAGSLALGLFPYLAVGLTPELHSWSSRHLLLTPLGFSLATVALSRLLLAERGLKIALAGILSMMILSNINSYFVHQREWYKWSSVTANMKSNETIKAQASFLVQDHSAGYDSSTTFCRFYEYAGMMKRAFGDERRFARDVRDTTDFDSYGGIEAFLNASYGLSSYVPVAPQYFILIFRGSLADGKGQTAELMVDEMFRKAAFDRKVAELVTLKVKKI